MSVARPNLTAMQATRSDYSLGVLLLLTSALTFSTAGLFTKGVVAGAWAVIFWRGLFAGLFTTFWTIHRGTFRHNFLSMGRSGLVVGVIGAIGTACFIPAFKLTSIANVALIFAASPLIASVLAWAFIGERPRGRTIVGACMALVGVAIIVSGSLGASNLRGDVLALIMTLMMSGVMVIYRARPDTPGAGPSVLQSIFLLPPAFLLGQPLQTQPIEIVILMAFGILFAIASVTLAEGAKRVPSGQTALLSSLETPLAPLLAFLVLSEVPNTATLIGGLVVFAAVLLSIRR